MNCLLEVLDSTPTSLWSRAGRIFDTLSLSTEGPDCTKCSNINELCLSPRSILMSIYIFAKNINAGICTTDAVFSMT